MTFGTRSKLKRSKDACVKIGGERLQLVPSYKYLRAVLDPALTFANHVNSVLSTVAHKSYVLGKMRKYLTTDVSLLIYKTMIMPYFDYADVVYTNAFKKDLDKLQRAQNRCLKTCLLVDARTETNQTHCMSRIPLLEHRRYTHVNNFMYTPLSRPELLDVKQICTRARDAPLFKLAKPRVEAYKRSVRYSGALQWNLLRPETRNVNKLLTLKLLQKKWLMSTIV